MLDGFCSNKKFRARSKLSADAGEQFVRAAYLSKGRRGPRDGKGASSRSFNYILRFLHGLPGKELRSKKDGPGHTEVPTYTRIYRAYRRWQADRCFDAIFEGLVFRLRLDDRLTSRHSWAMARQRRPRKRAAITRFSGHQESQGDKGVGFCDRHCNRGVESRRRGSPGQRNELALLRERCRKLTRIARVIRPGQGTS